MRMKPEEEQCSNCGGWEKCSEKEGIEKWNVLSCWYPGKVQKKSKKVKRQSIIEPKRFCFLGGFRRNGNGHK